MLIHHVGYCGNSEKEILHTLLNNFSDIQLEYSLISAYENGNIIGFLGLDIDGDKYGDHMLITKNGKWFQDDVGEISTTAPDFIGKGFWFL